MGISSTTGLASGLDTSTIINSLMAVERQAIDPVEDKKTKAQSELDEAQALNTLFLDVVVEAEALQEPATFAAKDAASSDEDALVATATSDATVGSYAVKVDAVAQAEQVIGGAVASDATFTGTLTITVGDGDAFSYAAEGKSLAAIAAAINADSAAQVSAQVVEAGDGQVRLLLTADESGAANTIALGGDLGSSGPFASTTTITQAQDAAITIRLGTDDPVEITRTSSSNSFAEVFAGLSFAIKSETDDFATITVAQDASGVVDKVSAFIDSLNAARSEYNLSVAYDSSSGDAGVFFTNYQLRAQVDAIQRALDTVLADGTSLEDMGVARNETTGLLEFDTSVLEKLLASDPDKVTGFFIDSGVGAAVNTALAGLTDSTSGVLPLLEEAETEAIGAYDDQIADFEETMTAREARYKAEFLAMETMIQKLNSQKSALTSFIDGLSSSDD